MAGIDLERLKEDINVAPPGGTCVCGSDGRCVFHKHALIDNIDALPALIAALEAADALAAAARLKRHECRYGSAVDYDQAVRALDRAMKRYERARHGEAQHD